MAANPSFVLHLGAHKTGTSLLQKYLRDRPHEIAKLRMASVRRDASNDLIGWGRFPIEHPERLREALLAVARTPVGVPPRRHLARLADAVFGRPEPRTVILSNENSLGRPFDRSGASRLYPQAAGSAKGLAASVGDLQPRIVYYIRSQEGYLESYYLQTVHQGGTALFSEWVAGIDVTSISWVPVVAALVEAFGEDRVIVRDFAEIGRGQNWFIETFLRSCDPTVNPTIDYQPMRNISVSQRGLEIALAMNPLLETSDERHAVRTFLQKTFNNTTSPRPVLLSEDEKVRLRDRYAAENRDLVARYGGGPA